MEFALLCFQGVGHFPAVVSMIDCVVEKEVGLRIACGGFRDEMPPRLTQSGNLRVCPRDQAVTGYSNNHSSIHIFSQFAVSIESVFPLYLCNKQQYLRRQIYSL